MNLKRKSNEKIALDILAFGLYYFLINPSSFGILVFGFSLFYFSNLGSASLGCLEGMEVRSAAQLQIDAIPQIQTDAVDASFFSLALS